MNYLEQLLGALAGEATRLHVVYEGVAAAACVLLAWLLARALFANFIVLLDRSPTRGSSPRA